MKILVFLLSLVCVSVANAQTKSFEVLNPSVIQGGVALVRIDPNWQVTNVCVSAFDKEYDPNRNGYVFLGIGIDRKPGRYSVQLVECGRGTRLDWSNEEVEVLERKLSTPWYVGPLRGMSKASQEQRAKDMVILQNAYSLASIAEDYTNGSFVEPLNSMEVTDSFGTPRLYGSYNRRTKKIKVEGKVYHGGVDLRAKTPLPVMAINSGEVILAHFFPLKGTEGNLLIIDHGSGILSLYMHLSKFEVKVGDMVGKGQVVARSGATPRGTPPHLHLMVKVNGTNVDPLGFIDTMNLQVRYQE